MHTFYAIYSLLLGLIIGSFLNVLIYRLPQHTSIVVGSSHCPKCQEPIKAYDLIPVFSYLFLRGRCRHCHAPISLRYPLIELLTGILFLLSYLKFGLSFQTLVSFIFLSILIVIAMIDFDTFEIYDRFHGMILVLAAIWNLLQQQPFLSSIIGSLIISLPFLVISYLTQGLGGGDVKLMASAGLLLGMDSILVAFFIASLLGGFIGLYLLLVKKQGRKTMLAFGPYLCIGIGIAHLYGSSLMAWYLNLIGF